MAVDRTALLREAGHVEDGAALPFEMRGHAQQCADRHDAGPADAGDEDAVGLVESGMAGLRQSRQAVLAEIAGPALFEPAAMDRHKARAEALDAGIILVAARLVDRALAAELGLDRHHRQAVRSVRAIAAAFADQVVDEDPLGRIGEAAALAAAAFLGGAGLVVDNRADPGDLAQFALHHVEIVAVAHAHAAREIGARRVFVGLVGDDDDGTDPFGSELAGQYRHGQPAIDRLAAGHRHGVVEQQLVGDVDFGGDRGADRQHARMGVGAVAEIGEDVRGFGERRLADPRHPLAAHLGEGRGRAVHELRQVVAADAGERPAALGHFRGRIVRAARAKIRGAGKRHDIAAELALLGLEKGEPLGDARRGVEARDALGDHAGDLGRR